MNKKIWKTFWGPGRYFHINRKYKDALFRLIFRQKSDLLDLYNAVSHTSYSDPEELQITTMEDAIYLGMKNDLSFLISNVLNLYEHQSTLNPNMPLRGLFYFTNMLRNYIEENHLDIYGTAFALYTPGGLLLFCRSGEVLSVKRNAAQGSRKSGG